MTDQPVHLHTSAGEVNIDWPSTLARLDKLLRIRTTPIGMKLFETVEEMEVIERIRRPDDIHTADQIVSMASRLNWTVGITADDLVGAQCQAVLGLGGQDDEWYSGSQMAGVWFETIEDSAEHQAAMSVVPVGTYHAMAVSPLSSGRLDPPDICMIYATPGQMIILINGLQWSGYRKLEWGASVNRRAPTHGGGRCRPANPACRSRAMPSAGTAG